MKLRILDRPFGISRPLLAGAVLLLASSTQTFATNLSIEETTISFDPNASTWYVTSRVCNNENGGHSGSLLYELRLTQGNSYYSIGSRSVSDTINGGYCLTFTGMAISVSTNVPNGTYGIQLVVGEYSGGNYITRDNATYDRTFIRGGSGDGRGGGQDDICAQNGWYGDGECDTFCPLADPDCYDGGGGLPAAGFCGTGFAVSNACAMLGAFGISALTRRRRRYGRR